MALKACWSLLSNNESSEHTLTLTPSFTGTIVLKFSLQHYLGK